MALSRTMALILARGFKRADMETDDHIETTERKALVAEVYNEIHSIVSDTGCRHFETEATITATGASSYALPAAWLQTRAIEYVVDSADRRRPLRGPVSAQRQHQLAGLVGDAYYYTIAGGNIVLLPNPASGSYKHRYLPQPTDYSSAATTDSIDLLNSNGESFMYWSLACLGRDKEESDLRYAEARRQHFAEELRMWAIFMVNTESPQAIVEHDDGPILPGDWYP